jgi:hypothetical protein
VKPAAVPSSSRATKITDSLRRNRASRKAREASVSGVCE